MVFTLGVLGERGFLVPCVIWVGVDEGTVDVVLERRDVGKGPVTF